MRQSTYFFWSHTEVASVTYTTGYQIQIWADADRIPFTDSMVQVHEYLADIETQVHGIYNIYAIPWKNLSSNENILIFPTNFSNQPITIKDCKGLRTFGTIEQVKVENNSGGYCVFRDVPFYSVYTVRSYSRENLTARPVDNVLRLEDAIKSTEIHFSASKNLSGEQIQIQYNVTKHSLKNPIIPYINEPSKLDLQLDLTGCNVTSIEANERVLLASGYSSNNPADVRTEQKEDRYHLTLFIGNDLFSLEELGLISINLSCPSTQR